MKRLKIFFDGSSKGNPGPAGLGVIIFDERGRELRRIGRSLGVKTNNEAEYYALLKALEEALKLGAKTVDLYSDSMLLVKQLKGEYKVKAPRLKKLYQRALNLSSRLDKISIHYISRRLNREADTLAKDAAKRVRALK